MKNIEAVKQEMREYGMSEDVITLAEYVAIILNKDFSEVIKTSHTELLALVVGKHIDLLGNVSELISGLKEEKQ